MAAGFALSSLEAKVEVGNVFLNHIVTLGAV